MQGLIQKSGYIKNGGSGAGNYMSYIAERPRSHGLFSGEQNTDLEKTMAEVSSHSAPVWTFIYSLKREDAVRLGYDSAASWRRLIMAHQTELADAMKISPNQFRWCAAYHDEKHHPLIHMIVWSADPKQGYLTEKGIEIMRSKLTNDIFQDELLHLYQQKDVSYQEVREAAQETMRKLIHEMESGICDCPIIEQKMVFLAETLKATKGKKVYGYLKKPAKDQVDAIVDELSQLPAVAECYEVWNKLRDALENYYKDNPRQRLPLSQQKEFKVIKNMVIQEAERIQLGEITFEDERMEDEQDEKETPLRFETRRQMVNVYREAKFVPCDDDTSWAEQEEAVYTLEQLWDAGFTVAAHQLGKCWRDGLGVLPDDEKAEFWFRYSAEAGNDFSQYALGKLLQSKRRIDEAVSWYEKASAQGNQYADYRLGKLYLQGQEVPQNMDKAVDYLTRSAESGNQYAQYTLGKLYLDQDTDTAWYWFSESAAQGNEYAQFFLDRWDDLKPPSVMLSVTRFLHRMGEIFRDNAIPPMGHKADDHEEQQNWGMTMR